jgi:aspartokinase
MPISDIVRTHLKNRPYTVEALRNGIVNYSALARSIQAELRIRNHHAVKAALIRYAEGLAKRNLELETRAQSILSGNRITLLDGMFVIISTKRLGMENEAEVKLGGYYVYLSKRGVPADLSKKAKEDLVEVHPNCSVIVISSEARLENVPGVIAFLTSVLAEQSINLIELISCYTETILVIRRGDALKTYQILSDLVGLRA